MHSPSKITVLNYKQDWAIILFGIESPTIFYNDQRVIFPLMFPEGTYMKLKCLRQPPPSPTCSLSEQKGAPNLYLEPEACCNVCVLLSVVRGHTQCQSNRTQCLALHTECSFVLKIIQQLKSIYFEVLKPLHFTSFSPLLIRMD